MTLRTRFILTIGGVALLLVLPGLYAAHQLSRLSEIAADVSHTHGAAYLAMGRLQARLTSLDRLQRAYVAIPEPEIAVRRDSALVGTRTQIAELSRAGYGTVSEQAVRYVRRIETEVARQNRLIAAGRHEEAATALDEAKPLFSEAESVVEAIATEIDERSEADLAAAARISASALTTTLLALVACLFIAVLLGAWATQTIVRPIHRLRRATAGVAAGEFVVPAGLPYDRQDEIGDLSRSFRGMAQQLADLDRMKADFMSIATHELKTPINVVSGYAELMQEGVFGEVSGKQDEALQSIQEQSRVLTQLVNQLLDISRLEAGGLRLEIADVVLADLLERVARTFGVLADRQQIDLKVELDDSVPGTIPADGERLRDQVLGNLLANALKFTPEGGSIRVHGGMDDGRVHVQVSDTGQGIAADQLPHVFDKYFQIGEQARSKGAGLGLTIAHEVVEAHGGTLTVDSVEGEGTTFHIYLPTSRDRVEAAESTAMAAATE